MNESTRDACRFLGAVFGAVAVILGAVFYGTYWFSKNYSCPAFAEAVDRLYKYDFMAGGCFVQTQQGQWVHSKNYWNNGEAR